MKRHLLRKFLHSIPLGSEDLYHHILQYTLDTATMEENGYPLPDTETPGKVNLFANIMFPPSTACRCGKKKFSIQDGEWYADSAGCRYHVGRPVYPYGPLTCCEVGSPPCGHCPHHVSFRRPFDDIEFVGVSPEARGPKHVCNVYALDCEMAFTIRGMELVRVSLVGIGGTVVYDSYVRPTSRILDYNTPFSGVRETDLSNITTTLEDVHETLLSILNHDTILVGHSLESDFLALNIVHERVVDTACLFPHPNGHPFKHSLRSLAQQFLNKNIQQSMKGHDSIEDATTCMELVLYRIHHDMLDQMLKTPQVILPPHQPMVFDVRGVPNWAGPPGGYPPLWGYMPAYIPTCRAAKYYKSKTFVNRAKSNQYSAAKSNGCSNAPVKPIEDGGKGVKSPTRSNVRSCGKAYSKNTVADWILATANAKASPKKGNGGNAMLVMCNDSNASQAINEAINNANIKKSDINDGIFKNGVTNTKTSKNASGNDKKGFGIIAKTVSGNNRAATAQNAGNNHGNTTAQNSANSMDGAAAKNISNDYSAADKFNNNAGATVKNPSTNKKDVPFKTTPTYDSLTSSQTTAVNDNANSKTVADHNVNTSAPKSQWLVLHSAAKPWMLVQDNGTAKNSTANTNTVPMNMVMPGNNATSINPNDSTVAKGQVINWNITKTGNNPETIVTSISNGTSTILSTPWNVNAKIFVSNEAINMFKKVPPPPPFRPILAGAIKSPFSPPFIGAQFCPPVFPFFAPKFFAPNFIPNNSIRWM